MQNEVFLVKKAATGDHAAFTMLVTKYRDKIYRMLYFMVHHEEDAGDLAQDTFLKAYQALNKLKNPEIFSAWITRIGMNLAVNHIKKKKRLQKCCKKLAEKNRDKKVEPPDEIVQRKELRDNLNNYIMELPEKQRSVFVLCDIQGYSYKEISDILKCRIGTVMSRLYYARNFLRGKLQMQTAQAVSSVRSECKLTKAVMEG